MNAPPPPPTAPPTAGGQAPSGLVYRRPPPRWRLASGEVHVISIPLTAAAGELDWLERLLSDEDRARADRFRTAMLRGAFVASRGALRAVLGGCLQIHPARVPLAYGPYGKPHLRVGRLRFNLSHSAYQALLAVSLDREVGVDIERIRPLPDRHDIARRFFCASEHRDLLSLPEAQRDRAFFTCWTRKEAYIKAVGLGLSLSLDSFRVSLLPSDAPTLSAPRDLRPWSLSDVSPDPDFAAALVCEGAPAAIRGWSFAGAGACAGYFAAMWRTVGEGP